jgi:rhamnose utilization protein RhaD (predicted bifunctional aldolase and dehydrogenase)/NAD(P)-dependent dehydrogenase (short-subunit alcohol dehydrogenase family)
MTDTIPTIASGSPWGNGPAAFADPLDQLVHLSNLIGRETRLVQPGGGNTSIKVELPDASGRPVPALLVKGSGTDLKSVGRGGFSRLSLTGLGALRNAATMSDAEMMRFMADCMLGRDGPTPSVETPLHSLLPHRVIAHTHDVATMSLTNLQDGVAERLVGEVFGGEIVYVPYVRPGFPLAQAVSQLAGQIPAGARGLALAHHGLVVWADDARECHSRLLTAVGQVERYLEGRRRGRLVLGPSRGQPPSPADRHRSAETVLPVIRGALGGTGRVVLHLDDSDELLQTLASERLPDVVGRGVATPEHILRAGRRPLWLDLDLGASADALAASVRDQLATQRSEYEAYHQRNASGGEQPLPDWAKVILVPGLGMVTAFKDKAGARTANLCYRATLETIENAEALGGFQFLAESDIYAFEHWPLERRKIEEEVERERSTLLVPRQIAVIIGGGSGIGRAASIRFAEEGAHVVVADLSPATAESVAAEIESRFPGRAIGVGVDVRDDTSLADLFRRTVLEFGGMDCLFYTAGLAPRFAAVTDLKREDLQRQLEVHYLGAVMAVAGAARVMRRQGLGGSVVASVSKAALAPGRDAAAYGGSKAAMWQALKVAAVELGGDGIRVNALNADQIETPLFLQFVRERATAKGISVEAQLELYRQRNLMGASLIPASAVADLAVLLASDKFKYTTGDILTIDGGLPEAFPR